MRVQAVILSAIILFAATKLADSAETLQHADSYGRFREDRGQYLARKVVDDDASVDSGAVLVLGLINVPPRQISKVEEIWLKAKEAVARVEGNSNYHMHRTCTDNTLFVHYSEWENASSFKAHMETKLVEETNDELGRLGATFTWSTVQQLHGAGIKTTSVGSGKFHIIINYKYLPHLRPDLHAFTAAFQEYADCTAHEDGNHGIVLTKIDNDNVNFWGWGNWDSEEDYKRHWEHEYTRKYWEKVEEADIAWVLYPSWRIEKPRDV